METSNDIMENANTRDGDPSGHENLCKAITSDDHGDDITDSHWSLADLPDVILVRIMKFLNLKERYYLTITCHRLNDFFTHPDLWKVAHINLVQQGGGKNLAQNQRIMPSILPKTMAEIVKRFSHLFQHLHLQTPRVIKPFERVVVLMLQDLANECRLESLSLSIGLLESKDINIQSERNFLSDKKHVHYITALLRNAMRLKRLNIISWPLGNDTKEDGILQSILSNTKLKTLESISLFYIEKGSHWTGRVPNLPPPEQMIEVLSFLPNLTRISLRSPMLNTDVIQLLASDRRQSLKKLKVLIMWSRATSAHDGCKIPDISDQAWRALKIVSPNVQVKFVIHVRIPFEELIVMFKPDVPLSSVVILRYGQCGAALIDSIASKYSDTLTSFVSLCDSDGCDKSLFNLIKECIKLDCFVYHGDVNYKMIMQMSDHIRDTKRIINSFEFNEKHVKTDNWLEEDKQEETVICQDDETQEYVIAPIQSWHFDQELHQRNIDMMLDHVKTILGEIARLAVKYYLHYFETEKRV